MVHYIDYFFLCGTTYLVKVYNTFNVLWIWFASMLLKFFASIFIRDTGLQFSFLVESLSGFGIRVIDIKPHRMS